MGIVHAVRSIILWIEIDFFWTKCRSLVKAGADLSVQSLQGEEDFFFLSLTSNSLRHLAHVVPWALQGLKNEDLLRILEKAIMYRRFLPDAVALTKLLDAEHLLIFLETLANVGSNHDSQCPYHLRIWGEQSSH
jgi:hypothetical protein